MTQQLELGLHLAPLIHPGRRPSIQETFEAFDRANPWVRDAIIALTRDYLRAGHTRVGIGACFERLRWEYDLHTIGSQWRIDNSLRSRYARAIAATVPDLADAFELRELRAALTAQPSWIPTMPGCECVWLDHDLVDTTECRLHPIDCDALHPASGIGCHHSPGHEGDHAYVECHHWPNAQDGAA